MGRVLIVESDPAVRELVAATLSDEEWGVHEASDLRTAREEMDRERPLAVILSPELLADWLQLRGPGHAGHDGAPTVPVVLLGGRHPEARGEGPSGIGLYDMRMPFSPLDLVRELEKVIVKAGESDR